MDIKDAQEPPPGADGYDSSDDGYDSRDALVRVSRESRFSQSLERGLAILGCFSPSRPVLGIADIAEDVGLTRSTTHRYVITLLALGYLEQGASRKYRLGLRVTDLGMSAMNSMSLRDHAHPYLQELRKLSSYTVSLSILDGEDILYVDRARSYRRGQNLIDLGLQPGSRLPAYCTAMGKLLLAHLPEEEQLKRIAVMKLTRRAPNTITSKKALLTELGRIREQSFAVNDQELSDGLHSIAAPVRSDSRDVVAAVNMAAHSSMISLPELVNALAPPLIATAARISARLGYRRDDEIQELPATVPHAPSP
ncbi:MAG TPA: IclR family transcriptional regulator [Solirubrobacteraceae bacterium]|nr:IclR family transcriptional regulator [Solirubrobacteraceae bacterium]